LSTKFKHFEGEVGLFVVPAVGRFAVEGEGCVACWRSGLLLVAGIVLLSRAPGGGPRAGDCNICSLLADINQMKSACAPEGEDESGGDAWPPEGWLTNRQTAERLGIGTDTLLTTWKYRKTLKAAARTVGRPGGGRCNLYPVDLVERIAVEREAASRAVVPDGFVDGDAAAAILGVPRGTWNMWLSNGTIEIKSTAMPGVRSLGLRKLYAVGDVDCVAEKLRAAGKLSIGPDELGPGKWLAIDEAAAIAGVWPRTWDIWSKSGRVPAGVWVKGRGGQATKMWPEKAAVDARAPETGDGTWVTTEETIAILRTSKLTLPEWIREGRVPAGVPGRSNGSAAKLWRAEELRALRAEWDARLFPPEGYVDRAGAEAALGISPMTLTIWVRHKRLDYAGELMAGPNEVECRVYRLDLLLASRERMRASEEAEAEAELPEGFVDFAGVAAFFGVQPGVINRWQRLGRLGRGEWRRTTGRQRRHVFAVAELAEARARMRAAAERPVAPPGFIELHDVSELLDVHISTIYKWERDGRLAEGLVVPISGTSARTKVYPRAEVERLREAIRAEIENFPPAGWLTLGEAARRANVSVEVWKRWLQEGRVERWQWASRPTMARCKLFPVEEVERVIAERGRDHDFLLEPDGAGGWRLPAGYAGRAEAAAMLGAAKTAFVQWQTLGWIDFGRWARAPVGAPQGVSGRRAYAVERLTAMVAAFEARGGPRPDDADPAVMRVPVFAPDGVARDALIDAADLPAVAGARCYWATSLDAGAPVTGYVATRLPDGGQEALRLRLLGVEMASGAVLRSTHLNGDRLDFRRANLLLKEASDHIHGTRKMRRTHLGEAPTSRFKGVCWKSGAGAWSANIMKDGVAHRLGRFADEIAAAQAYDEAARELYGPLAYQNFPDGVDARLEREAVEAGVATAEGQTEAHATACAA
jgi:predicted site-specific integrase-resolvase